jgi:hypothetical protein
MSSNTLKPNQTYSRRRGFRPAEYGWSRWWIIGASVPLNEATAFGTEFIHIEDMVESTMGAIAVYRQWVTGPDGADIENKWTPRREHIELRAEAVLRGSLRSMHMELAAEKVRRPALRIVRTRDDAQNMPIPAPA